MVLTPEERDLLNTDALKMAKQFNKFFQRDNTIAITGGTLSEDVPQEYREKALTPIDSCAVEGKCNLNKHTGLEEISVPNYKVIYGNPPDELMKKVKGKNVFVSGGTIANPYSRFLYTDVESANLNTLTIRELIENRTYPATFALEPQRESQILETTFEDIIKNLNAYTRPAESYRINPDRPNWIIDLETDSDRVKHPYEIILVPDTKDERGYKELNQVQIERYISKQYVPAANGDNWIVDYGILGKHKNRADTSKDVLANMGSHWLAGFGGNTIITFAENIPEDEDGKQIDIYGNPETLSTLYHMLSGEHIDDYQAIICTTRTPAGKGHEIISNTLCALIGLEKHWGL